MKKILGAKGFLLALFALMAMSWGASAQEPPQQLKLGFINSDRLFRESASARAADAKLRTEFEPRQKALDSEVAKFQEEAKSFERDRLTLAETERVRRQRDLAETERSLQRKGQELQEDFNVRKSEVTAELLERANRAVKEFAQSEGYNAILQQAAYFDPDLDVTDKIIAKLNATSASSKGGKKTSSAKKTGKDNKTPTDAAR